ncbi:hypothetical protein RISK_006228 [Rhodopirellula islandica]|uniref:Uncharacterized protein n=1 Tax=Rhodopirellula islandica TaxID=595434 RepID=A0A0J1E8E7_RHOIS|nr:hypothetical protein RISK_006228 [Rhodopirellula islandica]
MNPAQAVREDSLGMNSRTVFAAQSKPTCRDARSINPASINLASLDLAQPSQAHRT